MDTSVITENYIGAAVLSFMCLIIIIVHSLVVYSFIKRRQYRLPFYTLVFARSIAHIITTLSVFFATVPSMITGSDFFTTWINYTTLPFVSLYVSELLLALNRFVAVYLWRHYDRIWNKWVTLVAIWCSWTAGAAITIYGNVIDCGLKFDPIALLSLYENTICYKIVVGEAIFAPIMISALVFNLLTFSRILLTWNANRKVESNFDNRMRENARLFVFTFSQSLLWLLIMMSWSLQLATKFHNRLLILGGTIGIQLVMHFAEGCIYVAFNRKKIFSSPPTSTVIFLPSYSNTARQGF